MHQISPISPGNNMLNYQNMIRSKFIKNIYMLYAHEHKVCILFIYEIKQTNVTIFMLHTLNSVLFSRHLSYKTIGILKY